MNLRLTNHVQVALLPFDKYRDFDNLDNWLVTSNTPVKKLKINFHIFQDDNGDYNFENNGTDLDRLDYIYTQAKSMIGGGWDPSDPATSVCGTCKTSDSKIELDLDDRIYFYTEDALVASNSISAMYNHVVTLNPDFENQLNIFFCNGNYLSASGYATLPSYGDMDEPGYVVLQGAYSGSDWISAMTLAHEIGHNLDLCHTYLDGGCAGSCAGINSSENYFEDVYGDTYAGGTGNCPHSSGWSDPWSNDWDGLTNNALGGSMEQVYFSPLQFAKMHRSLSMTSVRKYVSCDSYSSTPMEITSDETWDFDFKIYQELFIKDGATLTITCKLVLQEGALIKVEQGSRLIVDGGIITSECGELWGGITAYGDRTLTQAFNTTYYTSVNSGVVVFDEALIENAHDVFTNGDGWTYNGGVVIAKNSVFRNCWRGFQFISYREPYGLPDASVIQYNTWETTDNLVDRTTGPMGFITMWDVRDPVIEGNIMQNTTSINTFTDDWRGLGVGSIDAEYKLERAATSSSPPCHIPNADKNQFLGLSRGVDHTSANSGDEVRILEGVFENVSRGIYCAGDVNTKIFKNTFDLDADFDKETSVANPYSVKMDGSTYFRIEENDVDWHLPSPSPPTTIGFHIVNSNASASVASSFIRNNTLNNTNYINGPSVGHFMYGHNEELYLTCNNYSNLDIDWWIDGNMTGNLMSHDPGPTDNVFTDPKITYSIYNSNINISPLAYKTNNGYPKPSTWNGVTVSVNYFGAPADCNPASYCDFYGTQRYKHDPRPQKINIIEDIYRGRLESAQMAINDLEDVNLKNYYTLIHSIFADSRNYTTLTENEKQALESFSAGKDLAANHSKAILKIFYGRHFGEDAITLPSKDVEEVSATPAIAIHSLNVVPNPSDGNFKLLINIQKPSFDHAEVRFYDLTGRQISTSRVKEAVQSLECKRNMFKNAGAYKAVLFIDGIKEDVANIIIQ